MVTRISNGLLTAQINHAGAELKSVYHNALRMEYMWGADPKFWGKTSPVLFPIVGALKGGAFLFQKKKYPLPRHGFARDHVFELEDSSPSRAVFLLRESAETLEVFPFKFELRITYELREFALSVTYAVKNPASQEMYFSLGAHPAFKVPLVEGTSYEDYFLLFNRNEDLSRWPITTEGLIETGPVKSERETNQLLLTKDLFKNDALVYKKLKSSAIAIRSHKHAHGLEFHFDGFPYFGIWAAPNADFVCLEPWCGIADSVTHDQIFEVKEGIQVLEAGGTWQRTWSVKCF